MKLSDAAFYNGTIFTGFGCDVHIQDDLIANTSNIIRERKVLTLRLMDEEVNLTRGEAIFLRDSITEWLKCSCITTHHSKGKEENYDE